MPRLKLESGAQIPRRSVHQQIAGLHPAAKGGNTQSGISYDDQAKVVMFVSGGSKHDQPYFDGWVGGHFQYSGQGQSGDMRWDTYNSRVLNHEELGYELHGFHKPDSKGPLHYMGEFRCAGYFPEKQQGADGKPRQAIMFLLAPLGEAGLLAGQAPATYLTPEALIRAETAMVKFELGERPAPSDKALSKSVLHPMQAQRKRQLQLPIALTGLTDGTTIRRYRREQTRLRDFLLSHGEEARCCLCGHALPPDLLVAAHLKRRAECSEAERLDFNVVRLMCTLGCDGLYERGYLTVTAGKVALTQRIQPELQTRISHLADRYVPDWERSAPYFSWHAARHLSRPKASALPSPSTGHVE